MSAVSRAPQDRHLDPYEVLGVPRDADADAIKSAYRRQAMRYHPDRNPGDPEAEERFKQMSEAYALLRDPEARARYDRYGASDPRAYRPDTSTVDWQTIFREADIPIDWGAHGSIPRTGNAVFDVLFGVMAGMMRGAGLLPGETREVDLGVRLGDLQRGAVLRLHVPGPCVCPTCRGSGRVRGEAVVARAPGPFETGSPPSEAVAACAACGGRGVRRAGATVEVTVPPGSRAGAKLRLRGLGGPGNPPGDVLARIVPELPPGARVQGNDVVDELYLTPLEAGREVRTQYQGVDVTVPKGVRDGGTVRVAGAGLGGDLVLTVRFDLLKGVSRAASAWFRKLARGGTAA